MKLSQFGIIALRVFALPFYIGFKTVFFISVILLRGYQFVRYGGELITYDSYLNRKTIHDTYNLINEQLKSK